MSEYQITSLGANRKYDKKYKYDEAFRSRAIELYKKTLTIRSTAKQVGICQSTLREWLKEAGVNTSASLTERRIRAEQPQVRIVVALFHAYPDSTMAELAERVTEAGYPMKKFTTSRIIGEYLQMKRRAA
jgi:transposase-like protein